MRTMCRGRGIILVTLHIVLTVTQAEAKLLDTGLKIAKISPLTPVVPIPKQTPSPASAEDIEVMDFHVPLHPFEGVSPP